MNFIYYVNKAIFPLLSLARVQTLPPGLTGLEPGALGAYSALTECADKKYKALPINHQVG
jgi:hypothetical protein